MNHPDVHHQYVTPYMIWAATVARGERDNATLKDMDAARNALARRADRVKSERKGLQQRYDAILKRMLSLGWR